jgi:hypothetical protein
MNLHTKVINIPAGSINTEATLYTPTSGKRWRLLSAQLQCSAAGVAVLKDNTGGTTVATCGLAVANTSYPFNFCAPLGSPYEGSGIFSAAADNVLTGQGINGNLSGTLVVVEE